MEEILLFEALAFADLLLLMAKYGMFIVALLDCVFSLSDNNSDEEREENRTNRRTDEPNHVIVIDDDFSTDRSNKQIIKHE